jgi:8-oxo-dGTP pyrophosphatase MutT (NUDIX family)
MSRQVSLITPVKNSMVLMQLRDFDERIAYPGQWAFFGGQVENDESPLQAAYRELKEEIGYIPSEIALLGKTRSEEKLSDDVTLIHHIYSCKLRVPIEALSLNEGIDLKLVSKEEFASGKIYSQKLRQAYEVAKHPVIEKYFWKSLSGQRVTV